MRRTLLSMILLMAALPGCEPSPPPAPEPEAAAPPPEPPSPWRTVEGSRQRVVEDPDLQVRLDAAIAEAQRTVGEAVDAWRRATDPERSRWAIKWAAETATGSTEYLWVVPTTFSPFRVEGHLANPPQQPLACGKGHGEVVAFPIDELVDWMCAPDPELPGDRRRGGFTVDVLE